MKSFAYGSNLCRGRLLERVPCAVYESVGCLPEHQLQFHKLSIDGSGKADAFRTGNPEDKVWGVVVHIPDDQREQLDAAEGLGNGYEEQTVTILDRARRMHDAVAYVAQASHIAPDLRPYDWYLQLVVDGARARGLPDTYVNGIARSPCVVDAENRVGRPRQKMEC